MTSGLALVVGAQLVVMMAGCSSAPATDFDAAGAYAAEFQQEYELSDSDFVKGMLADGEVTTAELQEAQRGLTECMADAGYVIHLAFDSNGLPTEVWEMGHDTVRFTQEESDSMTVTYNSCRDRWMGLSDTLYWYVRTNPNNENWEDLVAACLVRHGMVTEGFTGKDYGESWMHADEVEDPSGMGLYLPGGRGLGEPEGRQCEAMPLQ